MIERRTILWKKETDKAGAKEKQRLKAIEQSKGKSKNMLNKIFKSIVFIYEIF